MNNILEITKKLEEMGEILDDPEFVAILNLPDANRCEKRGEFVLVDGKLQQSCVGCVTQEITIEESLSMDNVKEAIDYFAENYGTKWITINGRGDPFHPKIKERTLEKIRYAASRGIKSYIFTAGNNLDDEVCQTLADYGVNVMISLYGNAFINSDFFDGKEYKSPMDNLKGILDAAKNPDKIMRFCDRNLLQDEFKIAENLRRLIGIYRINTNQPKETLRIGMNYVVSESDLLDNGEKIRKLKEAANKNGVGLFCNVGFKPRNNPEVQKQLSDLARTYSLHTTSIGGRCQMGAGSSTTIDYNGDMYRCPYMSGGGDGKFQNMTDSRRRATISGHLGDSKYACVMRKTSVDFSF